jgi:hypothetical protein
VILSNGTQFAQPLRMAGKSSKPDNKVQGSGGDQGGRTKGQSKKAEGRKSSGNKKSGT